MYQCEVCGFETGRLANFNRHLNRKNPCSSFQNVTLFGGDVTHNVTQNSSNVTQNSSNVTQNSSNVTLNSSNVTLGVSEAKKALQCEVCLKVFSSRAAKSRHKKNVMCKASVVEAKVPAGEVRIGSFTCVHCDMQFTRSDNLKRHEAVCGGNQSRTKITHNHHSSTTNNTTTNTNCNNTINNYVVNFNSYDKPGLDHVTMDAVKDLYLSNGRNLKKLIHAGVRKIWNTRENNSFKLPFGQMGNGHNIFRYNKTIGVFSDGEERLLPADHVVDVVLQKAAEVCESSLRMHYNNESIPGHAVLKHADVLEELAITYQEVWDNDKNFRSDFKPFVRTAILECILAADTSEKMGTKCPYCDYDFSRQDSLKRHMVKCQQKHGIQKK